MKSLAGLWVGLFVAVPGLACMDRSEPAVQVKQQVPLADLAISHWPARRDILIGSVLSVLVPKQATVEIQAIAKGMLDPVGVVSDEALGKAAGRIEYPEGRQPVDFNAASHRWVHLYARSFGKSQVVFKGPNGWVYPVVVGVVYASEKPRGEPVPLELVNPGQVPTFTISASRTSVWISVPGRVEDGWRLKVDGDVDLTLARVEELDVPYGDDPRVGVFLRAGASSRSGSAVLHRGGNSPASFPMLIQSRPRPAC
ncbi:MAG: hypothetical protein EBU81_13710 [Proteobacteria bacterium]|nr:hypothetical protein [Pseudomonadota bacterium]